ncbi:MAG TPA: tRNA 2-selenouridine(34) synthase MnmH [Bacteroidia bacterium]|jgi:tRNA 2-selenouridine synthase|nr:tRNA 2-selenouridine(34) synthase MnmH [Bacteroidia bacterium]
MQSVSAEEFFKLSAQYPVVDVRTPAEFERGHIPGAMNIPLFTNEERAIIGTLYVQEGKQPAMLKGLELVGPKFADFIKSAEQIAVDKTLLVHCWRGGMRSGGMAWLFEWYGFKVYTLQKGYKAFRHLVLETFTKPRKIKVLAGRTGSGKTLILHELEKQGATIIDLEGLANHKGSAFGSLGEAPQPTQEMLENEIGVRLLNIPLQENIWVEDESNNIGKRLIPNNFFLQMRAANVYYVDLPLEKRVEYLVKGYGKYTAQELSESIEKIKKRLGPQHAKAAIEAIQLGNLEKACEISLVYYDKSYDHGVAKRQASTIHKTSFPELDPEEIAKALIKA